MCVCACFSIHFQNQFVVDDVSKIIKEAIENTIGGNAYQHDKVNQWTSAVVENCLSVLTKLQKPYKYIGMYHTDTHTCARNTQHVAIFESIYVLFIRQSTVQ